MEQLDGHRAAAVAQFEIGDDQLAGRGAQQARLDLLPFRPLLRQFGREGLHLFGDVAEEVRIANQAEIRTEFQLAHDALFARHDLGGGLPVAQAGERRKEQREVEAVATGLIEDRTRPRDHQGQSAAARPHLAQQTLKAQRLE